MARRRLIIVLLALVLGVLGTTGAAYAGEAQRDPNVRDNRALCERLESKIQHLRAALGRLEAMSERIERKIASGELTEEELVRARHALAKIEELQAQLKERLERLLELYDDKCRR